tara:strand:- start:1672 stop:2277 length:606 start_codon:yes stop_codon:yes gene_type:complete
MKHEMIFGIPMFRYYLDPTELQKIAEEKFGEFESLPVNHPPDGWECTLRSEFLNCKKNEYKSFYDDILKQFAQDIGRPNGRCNIYESWLNYYTGGQNQEEHDHLPGFYSGCHFVKFNPDIHKSTRFVNPLYSLYSYQYKDIDLEEVPEFSSHHWFPDVKEGDIIIFPAWLKHLVLSQETTEHRITLAFNINTIKGSTRRVF